MNTQKTPFLDKFYMLMLVMLPILSRYQIGPLDLDIVVMLLMMVIFLFTNKYIVITKVSMPIVIIICYTIFVTGINLLFGQHYSAKTDIFLRMGRYCIFLFIVFCLGNQHANYDDLMSMYRFVALVATSYIILQAIVYYSTGIVLPSKIGSVASAAEAGIGRLRSFYSEPAAMSYSLVPFIACSLFGQSQKTGTHRSYYDALFVTIGIVLSTSGQGILCAGLLWGLWLLRRIFKEGLKKRDLLLIGGAVIAVIFLYASGILEYALSRAQTTGQGSAIDARYSGYVTFSLLSPLERLFGTGFGNYVVENTYDLSIYFAHAYYSSIAEMLFTLGIFGTMIWFGFFFYLFRRGQLCSRFLILAFLMLSLLGAPMSPALFPLWLTLMCTQLTDSKLFLSVPADSDI